MKICDTIAFFFLGIEQQVAQYCSPCEKGNPWDMYHPYATITQTFSLLQNREKKPMWGRDFIELRRQRLELPVSEVAGIYRAGYLIKESCEEMGVGVK